MSASSEDYEQASSSSEYYENGTVFEEDIIDEESEGEEEEEEENLTTWPVAESATRTDLDAWNISIYPNNLLYYFSPITQVQLASYNRNAPRDVPLYDNWVLIATLNCRLSISPEHRLALLDALQSDGHIIIPNTSYEGVLIEGNVHITMQDLVLALNAADVDTVRVSAYGMKHSILEVPLYLGNEEHPLAHTNKFDIGTTWSSEDTIVLFKPTKTFKSPGRKLYPMLLPVGRGYGSLGFKVRWPPQPEETEERDIYDIKMYSRLVHLLKAGSDKAPISHPFTIRHMLQRRSLIQKKIQHLSTIPVSTWEGVRVEVTVFGKSWASAFSKIQSTPLLDINTYLGRDTKYKHLWVKHICLTRDEVVQNGRSMLKHADDLQVFKGRSIGTTSKFHKVVALDLSNAIGFNFGRPAKPTEWDTKKTWWTDDFDASILSFPRPEAASVRVLQPALSLHELHEVRKELRSVDVCHEYFSLIRKWLTCQTCGDGVEDAYKETGITSNFRLQCKKEKHNLQGRVAQEYFLELIEKRLLPTPDAIRMRNLSVFQKARPGREWQQAHQRQQEIIDAASPEPARRSVRQIDSPFLLQPTPRHSIIEVVIGDSPPPTASTSRRLLTPPQSDTESEYRPSPHPASLPLTPAASIGSKRSVAEQIHSLHGIEALRKFFLLHRHSLTCPKCQDPASSFNQDHQKTTFRLRCKMCTRRLPESECKQLFIEYALSPLYVPQ